MSVNEWRGEARINGVRIPIDHRLMTRRILRALASSNYEKQETGLAMKVIGDGDVVLELGAGLGYISTLIRKRTRAGRIVCVEANPLLIPYIRNVHAINGVSEVDLLHGVADRGTNGGSVPFYCRAAFWSSSLDDAEPYDSIVETPTMPLARLIDTHKPSVLIVDIEGGELDLLVGIEDLGSVQSTVLEMHPTVYGTNGVKAITKSLQKLGFRKCGTVSGRVVAFERSPAPAGTIAAGAG